MNKNGIIKNRRGFTIVELTVSFSLTLVIVLILFQIVLNLKELYVKDGLKTELLIKQGLMTKKVAESFEEQKIKIAAKCQTGDNCLSFTFEDDSVKTLSFDKTSNTFHYGDYTTKLVSGSSYGKVKITNETFLNVEHGKKDSMITIDIPVTHPLVKGDYGVRVVYLYNSLESSVGDLNISDIETTEQLFLKGNSQIVLQDKTYTEPGYYVRKKDGSTVENDSRVKIIGSVGTASGTYQLIYNLVEDGKTISQRTRTVIKINTNNNFDYKSSEQEFTTPVKGSYKFELWGAQGGSSYPNTNGTGTLVAGGKGAYTSGIMTLDANEKVYIYVGEKGYNGSASNPATDTFNGGGSGGNAYQGGGSGGGATDIRLVNGYWNDTMGLRSRIMVAAGGAGASNYTNAAVGGYGGALTGGAGILNSGSASHTLATGGTQTAGGKGAANNGGAGIFGIGGNSEAGHGSGGGGGYYGGGGGGYINSGVSSGAGGSSFISGHNGCNAIDSTGKHTASPVHYSGKKFTSTSMIAGNASMPNPRGSGNITGNTGNGYAKITLVSIIS